MSKNAEDIDEEITIRKSNLKKQRNVDVFGVFIVFGLSFFHASMFYATDLPVEPINEQTTIVLPIIMGVFMLFAMPILFISAGRSTWFNLEKRNAKQFLWERTKRLLIPFIVSMVLFMPLLSWMMYSVWHTGTIMPVEDYTYITDWNFFFTIFVPDFFKSMIETIQWGGFPFILPFFIRVNLYGNYVQLEDRGYFQMGHLWFLYLLFLMALFLLPLLILIRRPKSEQPLDKIVKFFEKPATIFLLAIPIMLFEMLLAGKLDILYSYGSWISYTFVILFLYGFLIAGNKRYKEIFRKNWKIGLGVGGVLSIAAMILAYIRIFLEMVEIRYYYRGTRALATWFLIVGMIGLGEHLAKKSKDKKTDESKGEKLKTDNNEKMSKEEKPKSEFKKKLFKYLSRAQLPFYIIHFPILAGLAYVIVPLNIPWFLEYLILVLLTIIVTMVIYDLIRRTIITRFLFGIKEKEEDIEKKRKKRKERKARKAENIT